MHPSANAKFEVVGNTLRVSGQFGYEDEAALEAALSRLARVEHDTLVVDLSGVSFMASSCVRYVVHAALDAKKAGRAIKVVAGGQVLRLVNAVQLARYAEVVASTVPPGP